MKSSLGEAEGHRYRPTRVIFNASRGVNSGAGGGSSRDSGRRAKETMMRETLVPTRLFLVKTHVGVGPGDLQVDCDSRLPSDLCVILFSICVFCQCPHSLHPICGSVVFPQSCVRISETCFHVLVGLDRWPCGSGT